MKFRKKPVVIEARQFTPESAYEIAVWCGGVVTINGDAYGREVLIDIPTLEGVMRGTDGDWIIEGVQGEYYPCKPDIFAATYERVQP